MRYTPLYLCTLLYLPTTGCAANMPPARAISEFHSEITIVSLNNEFKTFWALAKDAPVERQLDLWTAIVESPHQQFFDYFVWSNRTGGADAEHKRRQALQRSFLIFNEHESKITHYLNHFSAIITEQLKRYIIIFPDFDFPLSCYGIIGANFLGRAGTAPWNGERTMAFGIEKLISMDVNTDLVYSHEIFHIYHSYKSNIDADERLVMQLWAEGLASYASHLANPSATKTEIFMYDATAKIKDSELARLASKFLEIAHTPTTDASYRDNYSMWFISENGEDDIPVMAGYWLGYKVVERLQVNHQISEMVGWSVEKADKAVTEILRDFANSPEAEIHR